jgi:creatinine amidohydrolase
MKWEELTAPEFEQAVKATGGVCVVPIGVIEKHGDHLPLGTDMMFARYVVDKAAEQEPVIVFPDHFYTQIYEARHQPGAIAIRHELMFDLLENICEEISRNGMKKIILYNAHGGNNEFLPYFMRVMLEKTRDYVVFLANLGITDEAQKKIAALAETKVDGHAGEQETSAMLAIMPDCVRLDRVDKSGGTKLGRLAHLPRCRTAIEWYAEHPQHVAGDGRYAKKEMGEIEVVSIIGYLVKLIRAVKEDTEAMRLTQEFYGRCRHYT